MVSKKVVIIGAGISGVTVANNLSGNGVDTMIIERNPYPGGRAVFYGCKATDTCARCGVCLVRDALNKLKETDNLVLSLSSVMSSISRQGDNGYELTIERSLNHIDPALCVECGLCQPVCPEDAVKKISDWKYYIDKNCTACGECVKVCPVSAISLEKRREVSQVHADSIVVCTGFQSFDPSDNLKWGYGNNPHVITATDLEKFFYEETYPGKHVKHIAFIQCVGSRNITEGVEQCSRICCAYALRMANKLAYDLPDREIDFYYMDIQGFGKQFPEFWMKIKDALHFIRSNPISVTVNDAGKPLVRFECPETNVCIENSYDLVVLSHGLCPQDNAPELADLLGLGLDSNGFFQDFSEKEGVQSCSGIFVAGACRQPMRIDECVQDATSVSEKVLSFLGGKAAS
jgi:heterodisulfide reductase subunit A